MTWPGEQMPIAHKPSNEPTHITKWTNTHHQMSQHTSTNGPTHTSTNGPTHINKWTNTHQQMDQHTSPNGPTHINKWTNTHINKWTNTHQQMDQHTSPNEPTHINKWTNTHINKHSHIHSMLTTNFSFGACAELDCSGWASSVSGCSRGWSCHTNRLCKFQEGNKKERARIYGRRLYPKSCCLFVHTHTNTSKLKHPPTQLTHTYTPAHTQAPFTCSQTPPQTSMHPTNTHTQPPTHSHAQLAS